MFSFILILAFADREGCKKGMGVSQEEGGGVRRLKRVGGNKGNKKGMGERGGMIEFCR